MIPQRLRILFSEDDQDTREMISILLDGDGFDVICSETAEQALDLARVERFDAYVLDDWMPGMSGLNLCRAIREFNVHTPIIFYTASAFDRDRDEAFARGAQAYVTKPCIVEELEGAIRSAIELRPGAISDN